jgi:folate-binding Fe-S cluster repair protein YgfZ
MCGIGSFELEDSSVKYYSNGDHSEYDLLRLVNAVVEGSAESGGHFPLHLNFNQLNGVSTTKGCYIG